MKTMINFSVVVMMAVFSVCVAQAESLTVFDNGHRCCFTDKDMTMTFKSGEGFQVIYPESALSSMKGQQINAMMYYMDGTHGNGIDCSKVRASLAGIHAFHGVVRPMPPSFSGAIAPVRGIGPCLAA